MEELDVEFSAFNLNVQVTFQSQFTESIHQVTGWALCTPEGEISHLTLVDRDELADAMLDNR